MDPAFFLVAVGSTCRYVLNIFFMAKKVLSIAKAHMSEGTLSGAVASADVADGVFLVSIL